MNKRRGRRPYGRTPKQIEAIKFMRLQRNLHHGRRKSYCEIANLMNNNNIKNSKGKKHHPPPAGKMWYPTTIENILTRTAGKELKQRRKITRLESDKYLNLHQAARIYETLDKMADSCDRSKQRSAIIITLLCTGLRNFELCDLQMQDIPFVHDKDEIVVRSGKGKKGGVIEISPEFRNFLDRHIMTTKTKRTRENKTEWVFRNEKGYKLSTDSIRHIVKRFGRTQNLPFMHPHALRHSYGSILYFATKDIRLVQSQLRHTNIATTQVYVNIIKGRIGHQTPQAIKNVIGAIEPAQNEIVQIT